MVYAQYVINIAQDVGVLTHIVLGSSHSFSHRLGSALQDVYSIWHIMEAR
jgi:hypothetical protein